METINDTNYELWLVRYADGDLTADERKAVEQWLEKHPEAAEELRLYGEAPRLERDAKVKYEASLPGTTVSLWPKVLRWSAAAAVVVALAVSAVRLLAPQEQPMLIAEADAPIQDNSLLNGEETQAEQPDEAREEVSPRRVRAGKGVSNKTGEMGDNAIMLAEAVQDEYTSATTSPCSEGTAAQDESRDVFGQEVAPHPLLAETETPVVIAEDEAVVAGPADPQLVYVDNLFVVDSGNVVEQRLLAVNETIKERLQSTYLGRRLARRMPTGEELLDYTDNLRERTPQGVRMMTDMVLAYNESNK